MKYWHLAILAAFAALIAYVNSGAGAWILTLIMQVPHGDKYCHFALYFSVALACIKVCNSKRLGVVYVGALLAILVAAVEELSQGLVSHRQLEWADFAANLLGICSANILLLAVKTWQLKTRSPDLTTQ